MRISVIIPTWNRADCIERAINSCQKADEIIVVDDGSTDNTYDKLIYKKGIKHIILKENKGVNNARNKGILQATGDYIIFLDSDDELTVDAIETIRNAHLEKINFFRTKNVKSNIQQTGTYTYKDWLEGKTTGEFLGVYKKEIFNDNLFDPELFCFEIVWVTNTIKKEGWYKAFNKIIRIYHDEQKNRMSKELSFFKHITDKYEGYCQYYDIVIDGLTEFQLKKKEGLLIFKILLYKYLRWIS